MTEIEETKNSSSNANPWNYWRKVS